VQRIFSLDSRDRFNSIVQQTMESAMLNFEQDLEYYSVQVDILKTIAKDQQIQQEAREAKERKEMEATATHLKKKMPVAQVDAQGNEIALFASTGDAAKKLGLTKTCVFNFFAAAASKREASTLNTFEHTRDYCVKKKETV